MEAPKCKICGEKHYGLCKRSQVAEAVRETIAMMPKPDGPIIKGLKEAIEHAAKFDRNAYQRDYMRKKRAKDKAAKPL